MVEEELKKTENQSENKKEEVALEDDNAIKRFLVLFKVFFLKIKDYYFKLLKNEQIQKYIIYGAGGTALFIFLSVAVWFSFIKEEKKIIEKEIVIDQLPINKAEDVFEDIIVLRPFKEIKFVGGKKIKSVSMNLSLELTDVKYKDEIKSLQDNLRQIIEEQVKGMTWFELRNSEGKISLKYKLLEKINSVFPRTVVRNIYFTYFLMK